MTMDEQSLDISRRDALQSVAATGSLAVIGSSRATNTAAQSTSAPGLEGREHGWTAPVNRQVETYHSGHRLSYLNVSWDYFGVPGSSTNAAGDVDHGCWRHTFALSAAGVNDEQYNYLGWNDAADEWSNQPLPGLPYSSFSVNVPRLSTWDDPTAHPSRGDWSTSGAPNEDKVAVGVRRHPSLMTFFDRFEFEKEIIDNEISPFDISQNGGSDVHDDVFTAFDTITEETATAGSMPGLHPLLSASISEVAGMKSTMAAQYTTGATLFYELFQYLLRAHKLERRPRFDHGFAFEFPVGIFEDDDSDVVKKTVNDRDSIVNPDIHVNYHNDVWLGSGGHVALFDVFENPSIDSPGVVDVVSAFDLGPVDDGPRAGWTLTLDTPAPPNGDPTAVPADERYSATVTRDNDVTRRNSSEE